jgi:hypothetical protein
MSVDYTLSKTSAFGGHSFRSALIVADASADFSIPGAVRILQPDAVPARGKFLVVASMQRQRFDDVVPDYD